MFWVLRVPTKYVLIEKKEKIICDSTLLSGGLLFNFMTFRTASSMLSMAFRDCYFKDSMLCGNLKVSRYSQNFDGFNFCHVSKLIQEMLILSNNCANLFIP